MSQEQSVFDELETLLENAGALPTLDFLAGHFREQKMYGELFEVLKMKSRRSLDLPVLYGDQPDDLSEQQQLALDQRLLDACRDVGTLLLSDGRIAEGWMYLQPLADRNYVADLIKGVAVNEENVDLVIDIALRQSVAPDYGYRLLLENHGTCNSITSFDTLSPSFPRSIQEKLSTMLVEHIYRELQENIAHHIRDREKSEPKETRVSQLMADRAWLFADGGHHLDTTHLASAMRIARVTSNPLAIEKAVEMAEYGKQLDADFHFPGHPPFEDTYPDHLIYFRALLGENVDQAIEHFRVKADLEIASQSGTLATEHFVALLDRLGRRQTAIDFASQHLSNSDERHGIAPSLIEIAKTHEDLQSLIRHYRIQQDVLGFAVSLLLDADLVKQRK